MAIMDQPDRIHLRDHVVAAEIGAFQSERGKKQRLRFSITVDLRQAISGADDQVDRILSYDVLTQAVDTALADQRYNLVETLAERIAAEVLAYPQAEAACVRVEKLDRGPGALGITVRRVAGRVAASRPDLPVRLILWRAPARLPQEAAVILPDAPALPLPAGGNQRRIALLALDQAAWALAGPLGLDVAETRTELDHAIRMGQPVVWAPARLAADAADAGQDPVSLIFWLARQLRARRIDFAQASGQPLPSAPADLPVTLAYAER